MNWYSFSPRKYKINLVKCLLRRAWNICSDEPLFNQDWETIKSNLMKNQYPENLLNAIKKNFVEKMKTSHQKTVTQTVEKKEILLILPFHGKLSSILDKRLSSLLRDAYPQVNLKVIFRTTFRIANLFVFKDKLPLRLKSHVVYGVHCTNCDSFYVGKTKRHVQTRFKEHRDPRKQSAVMEHLIRTGHDVSIDNLKIYENGKFDKELLIKESLVIKNLQPDMNENVASYPLELF